MENFKHCDLCNVNITKKNWSRHRQSASHKNKEEINTDNNTIFLDNLPFKDEDIEIEIRLKSPYKKELKKWPILSILKKDLENYFKQKLPDAKVIPGKVYRKCKSCGKLYHKKDYSEHMKLHTRKFKNPQEISDYVIEETDEALEKCFLTLRATPQKEINSVYVLMEELPELMFPMIKDNLEKKTGIKVQLVLKGKFKKFHPATSTEEFDELTVPSKNRIILRKDEIEDAIKDSLNAIHEKIESWDNNEGYWHLVNVIHVDFKLREYKPLSASSYIPTPNWISSKKAIINIKNEDQKCFKYCLLYHKHKNEISHHAERITHYKKWDHLNEFNFEGIKFPVEVGDIRKFCQNNEISVNVYIVNEKEILPYRTCTQEEKKPDHVNLLLLENSENNHYVYITNLSKLIKTQLTKNDHNHFMCDRCFYHTNSEDLFRRHQELCDKYLENENAIPILPKEGENILKFKNIHKTIRVPLVYYADLEAILRKLNHRKYRARHEACAYSFFALGDFYKNFIKYTGKSAKDSMNSFVQTLKDEASKLSDILKQRLEQFKNHNLSINEEKDFQKSKQCHFCKKEFTENDTKVRDHCHLTGKFRGAAHQSCNLKVGTSLKIPVFFHNGSGYDFKHFIRKLYKIDRNLKVLSQTEEKYFSITINVENTNIVLEFKDSLRFLLKSIDKSSEVLYKKNNNGIKNFKNSVSFFKEKYPEITDDKLELLVQKGVFPYSYLDSFERLEETEFPSIESFYDHLKERNIDINDYERGKKIWNYFKCQTLKDYMEIYLTCDVLILADCFEGFRNMSMEHYGLDPAHYISSPGLSWDAMLKYTKVELELLTDLDMLYFFMDGIRGGLSCIMKRNVKANNKYMINYDPNEESSFLVPVDANNLYGDAMSWKSPQKNFKWCTDEEIKYLEDHLMEIPDDNDVGYAIKVETLNYDKELHDSHNDYAFFPEHKMITKDMLSPYQKRLMNKKLGSVSKTRKLVASLEDKHDLICDYRTLKQSIQKGLKITKIKCAIKYTQTAWLKPYIDKNTELREKSTSDFEVDFFKLMNNAVYGKTIENVLKRQDIKFCSERTKALKYIKKINFKRETVFSKNLVAIHMNRMQVKFDKPIYAGFCTLEMSKWRMFQFVYEYLKPKWGDKIQIIQTDTDGLLLYIKTEDFYEDIKVDIDKWFDTSNFSENNRFGIERKNKKKLGCFKIETGENIVTRFIGLRAKMYCYTIEHKNSTELKKREKGVPAHITNRHQLLIWKKVLDNETQTYATYNQIKSEKLNVYTIEQMKVALSNFDDKRYILDDGYTTLAHGHYKICEINSLNSQQESKY